MIAWFAKAGFRDKAVAILRPDRFVFAVVPVTELDRTVTRLRDQLGVPNTGGGTRAAVPADAASFASCLNSDSFIPPIMCPLPDDSRIHAAADALRNARATRTPVEPIAERFGIASSLPPMRWPKRTRRREPLPARASSAGRLD